MSQTFEVGNKVTAIKYGDFHQMCGLQPNFIGIIAQINPNNVTLDVDNHRIWGFSPNNIRLINSYTDGLRHRTKIAWKRGDYNL